MSKSPFSPPVIALLRKLYENRRLILSGMGAAGYRFSPGENRWVCDPWTEAFDALGEELAALEVL